MSQSDKPFSVRDRRHFTPEGQPRDESSTDAPALSSASALRDEAEAPLPAADEPAKRARGAAPIDLSQFLLSLGAQAGMLLSGAESADGAPGADALEGARSIISILEMLRDKTEGRRTPAEEQVLDGLLYELRLAYVERTRTARP